MSKIKFTGRSEEDAVRKAADTLGCDPSAVQYKIVSRAGGLLGLLGQTVTVEVSVGEPAPEAAPPTPPPLPQQRTEREPHEHGERRERHEHHERQEHHEHRDEHEQRDTEQQVAEHREGSEYQGNREQQGTGEHREERGHGGRRDRRDRPRHEHGDRPRRDHRDRPPRPYGDRPAEAGRKPHAEGEDAVEETVVDPAVFAQKMEHARTFLSELLRISGGEAEIVVAQRNAEIGVSLAGKLPEWLGRSRGHVMDSLQFLANKVVNRFPPRYRISISVEGVKEERDLNLDAMAADVARRVNESGVPMWILPMSAKERRAVHMAVSQVPGLTTRSVGEGAARRVCVSKEVSE